MTTTRKRKTAQMGGPAKTQLKPLQGAQIEAVTKTYNELRAHGVDSVVEFPATVVAGDTSSGKSSVMCRLTGLPFPRGEGIVTRFATEVEMLPANSEEILVFIRPDLTRLPDQQAALKRFKRRISLQQFQDTFRDACFALAQLDGRRLFADTLHISLKGPACQPLTVIDLPGLIHAATSKVSDDDRKLSEMLAKKYVSEKRTIVLAVIAVSNDVVNQAITRMTRDVDKDGERTLGIVTKVDEVCGSKKDMQLRRILSNEEIALKLGWHALVNVVDGDESASEDEIDKLERKFFKEPRFEEFDEKTTGIDNLRNRVVQVVGAKLVNTLPALHADVAKKLEEAKDALRLLGEPVAELNAQRKMLMKICARYESTMKVQVSGVRSDDEDDKASDGGTLRSDIDILNGDFANIMASNGATKRFSRAGSHSNLVMSIDNAYKEWRSRGETLDHQKALNWVKSAQMLSPRGAGSGGDHVVAQLFRELSKNWAGIARHHIDNIAHTCKKAISSSVLDRTTEYSDGVADKIEETWIHPHIDAKLQDVKVTLNDLDNDTFKTSNDHNLRLEKLREKKERALHANESQSTYVKVDRTKTIITLAEVLAYYEVDLEYWTTAVIRQVAERFVRCIPKALSSEMVFDLPEEEIKAVMTESTALATERKRLTDKVDMLEFALSKLSAQIQCLQ